MNRNGKWIILIFSMCLLTPFSNDIYIASLPSMAHIFQSTKVKYVVTVFMIGLALGQIICGPLSDRFGRKPLLIGCLSIFCLASVGIVFANNLSTLLSMRFIQALACSATVPGVLAIAKDSFKREQLINVIPIVLGTITLAPIIAPIIGGVLQTYFGWRASFIALFMMGVFFLLVMSFIFKESIQEKNLSAINPKVMLSNYYMLLSNRNFISYALTAGFCYGILFSYLSASSFIFINQLHLSVNQYTLCFAIYALTLGAQSFLLPLIAKRFNPANIIKVAAVLTSIGSIILLILNHYFMFTVASVLLPMMTVGVGIGLARSCAATLCMHVFPPKYAGISSAVFNFVSFATSGIATAIIAIIHINITSFAIVIISFSILAVAAGFNANRKQKSVAESCA